MRGKEFLEDNEIDVEDLEYIERLTNKLSKMPKDTKNTGINNKWYIKNNRKQKEKSKERSFNIPQD
jgi:hypothetical protein